MATLEEQTAEGRRVVEEDRQHIIHSWSVQSAISPLAPPSKHGLGKPAPVSVWAHPSKSESPR